MNRTVTRLFVVIFLIAVAVNFAWEMAQSVLFTAMGGSLAATWRCFVASLGDGVIVLAIAGSGWLLFGQVDWFVRPGMKDYLMMTALGITIAVLVERYALAAGRWAYTDRMPILPVLNVGVVPVLQMVVLPPIVFVITATWSTAKKRRR
jgi:hypothetical protein